MAPNTRDRSHRPRGGPDADARARRATEAQQTAYQAAQTVLVAAAARRDVAWREAAEHNRRRALSLLVPPFALGVVLVLVGIVALPLLVVGLAVLVAAVVWALAVWRRSSATLLRRIGGATVTATRRPEWVEAAAAARVVDVAEGLCSGFGLRSVEVRALHDPAPNALSVGRSQDAGTVVVTTGLLALLDRIELEAALAHELAHLKRGDTRAGDAAAVVFGHLGRLGGPLGPLASKVTGKEREALADVAAVGVTRYPPGLLSALEKIAAAPSRRPASLSGRVADATGRLWLAPFADLPVEPPSPGALDLDERIDALREI